MKHFIKMSKLGLVSGSIVALGFTGFVSASGAAAIAGPRNVVATPGNAQIAVRWVAPRVSGGSVQYTAVATSTSTRAQSKCSVARSSEGTLGCTITNLTNGLSYNVHVEMSSKFGSRTARLASTISLLGPPSAPQNVAFMPEPTGVVVMWLAPSNSGGSPVTGYSAVATDLTNPDQGGQRCSTNGNTDPRCTIGGLVAGDRYTVSVTASSALGVSPPAQPATSEILGIVMCSTGQTCDYGPSETLYQNYENMVPYNLNDCTLAAVANWETIVLGETPNQTDIINQYNEMDVGTNSGVATLQLFDAWENGGIGGVTISSYTPVSASEASVESAVSSDKALLVDLSLSAGETVGTIHVTSAMGHFGVVDGFTPTGPLLVTWGMTLQMTWAQWNTEAVGVWSATASGA
jgi:hypothetical protein